MIAVVWNAPFRLIDITTRLELYVRGLRALGEEVLTVCSEFAAEGYEYPVYCFESEAELAHPQFWQKLGCEGAIILTWHRMNDVLSAMRIAGVARVAIGDSDGQLSLRYSPKATFQYMTLLQNNWLSRILTAKEWLRRYLFRAKKEHRALIENVILSEALLLPSEGGVNQFNQFLRRLGAGELTSRVHAVPYPVPEQFCTTSMTLEKTNRVIAIGRWDSPQKDAGLLAKSLEIVLRKGTDTQFLLIGNGGHSWFSELTTKHKNVRYLGFVPREEIGSLLARSRAILFSSRWEGSPIAANEALASGATIVSSPLVSLNSIVAGGRFGTISATRRPSHLAEAIEKEMGLWNAGQRNPQTIADYWRQRLHPVPVCRLLLQLLEQQPIR